MSSLDRQSAVAELWRRGHLSWKLHAGQQRLRHAWLHSDGAMFVALVARQFGKSYWSLATATEVCLSLPMAQVRYCAPTAKMVRKIILPLIRELLRDCPDSLRPEFRSLDQTFVFPSTGSEMHVVGLDHGHAESARGARSDLIVIDEAAFVADLRYVVESILKPQLMHSDGKIMLVSTPPKSPSHEMVAFVREAKAGGWLAPVMTIRDNPMLTAAQIEGLIADAGGMSSTSCRRELFAEVTTEADQAVAPEFSLEAHVRPIVRPPEFSRLKRYVSMDVGFDDLTFAVFGYYDFNKATLCVEDEAVLRHGTTKQLAELLLAKEENLWGALAVAQRVCDTDKRLISDLHTMHGITFSAARKDNKQAALNHLRVMLQNKQIQVDPRCKQLIAHLAYGIWNRSRTSYARMHGMGHFDGIDALVYMARHVDQHTNTAPVEFHSLAGNQRSLREQHNKWRGIGGLNLLKEAMR